MDKKTLLVLIIITLIGLAVIFGWKQSSPTQPADLTGNVYQSQTTMSKLITLQTNLGDITFALYEQDAPTTTANFIKLASEGYYNNLTFHRVIPGFMIQGGDPNCSKTPTAGPCGTGGPGYQFADELDPSTPSYQAGYRQGVVAMANAGPNTNGSQFFIMLEDYPLPNNYTIFGKVTTGQEIVNKIGQVATGAGDRPLEPVIIQNVKVEPAG